MISKIVICIVCFVVGVLLSIVYARRQGGTKFSIKYAFIDSIGFIIGWLIVDIVRGSYSNLLYLVFFLVGFILGEFINKYDN